MIRTRKQEIKRRRKRKREVLREKGVYKKVDKSSVSSKTSA
jgi:hypothetical protein